MNRLLEKVGDFNDLLLQGRDLEAMENFYDDEVEVWENDCGAVKGKSQAIQIKKEFLSTISELYCAKPLKVTVGEGTTMVEWHLSYELEEGLKKDLTRVAVQEWKDGRIIREMFYYQTK